MNPDQNSAAHEGTLTLAVQKCKGLMKIMNEQEQCSGGRGGARKAPAVDWKTHRLLQDQTDVQGRATGLNDLLNIELRDGNLKMSGPGLGRDTDSNPGGSLLSNKLEQSIVVR